jgi:hypothetical protein
MTAADDLDDACPSCGYAMVSNDDWWDRTPQGRPTCPECGVIPEGFELRTMEVPGDD